MTSDETKNALPDTIQNDDISSLNSPNSDINGDSHPFPVSLSNHQRAISSIIGLAKKEDASSPSNNHIQQSQPTNPPKSC